MHGHHSPRSVPKHGSRWYVPVPSGEAPKEAPIPMPSGEQPKEAVIPVPSGEAPIPVPSGEAPIPMPSGEEPKEALIPVPSGEEPKGAPPHRETTPDRAQKIIDAIQTLCVAKAISIEKKADSFSLVGKQDSIQIDEREFQGLVGGISKDLTLLSAQQASEARDCMKGHLDLVIDVIIKN
jgi:hypothetical protein